MSKKLVTAIENVIPSPSLSDRFPDRGLYAPATEPPPPFAFTLDLRFADGSTGSGIWTGKLWWGQGGQELHPLGWRWANDFGMSHRPPVNARREVPAT